jgi:gentisate 1,2-dioxygenase
MPTIAAFIQLLPARFQSQAYRSTDGTIYSVVEGGGRVTIGSDAGGLTYEFEPRDTFVVPSWAPVKLETAGETVLFSFSDRPGQEAMGLWREKRG